MPRQARKGRRQLGRQLATSFVAVRCSACRKRLGLFAKPYGVMEQRTLEGEWLPAAAEAREWTDGLERKLAIRCRGCGEVWMGRELAVLYALAMSATDYAAGAELPSGEMTAAQLVELVAPVTEPASPQ